MVHGIILEVAVNVVRLLTNYGVVYPQHAYRGRWLHGMASPTMQVPATYVHDTVCMLSWLVVVLLFTHRTLTNRRPLGPWERQHSDTSRTHFALIPM